MKNLLFLFAMLGVNFILSPLSQAQYKETLNQAQTKDAENLIGKIKAILPVGWNAEYLPKGSKSEGDSLFGGTAFNFIEVTRVEKVKMHRRAIINGNNNNYRKGEEPPRYIDEEFKIIFDVEPSLSQADYDKTAESNRDIKKRLWEMLSVLNGMKMNRKFDYFFPKTPEQKVKVKAYNDLKLEIVRLPEFYFQKIGLNSWGYGLDDGETQYYRVQDKAIRRECAIVTQDVYSLLTSYTGEKFKIDEEVLKGE